MADNNVKNASTLSWIAAIGGIWLLLSPFIFGFTQTSRAEPHAVVLGILIAAIGAGHAYFLRKATWLAWVNGVAGLWVLVSPWVLGFASVRQAVWNSVIIGLLVAVASIWSASLSEDRFRRGVTA